MKRILLALAGALLAALVLGSWLLDDPGYVRVLRGPWELETSLAFAVLVLVLAALALIALTLAAATAGEALGSLFAPARWRRRRAHQRLRKGFRHLLEGDWQRAERLLERAADHGEWPLPALLGAALGAWRAGKRDQAEALLDRAAGEPDGEPGATLLRARLLLNANQPAQARTLLQSPGSRYTQNRLILESLAEAGEGDGDWITVTEALSSLRRLDNLREPGVREQQAWHARLRELAEKPGFEDREKRLGELRHMWKKQVPVALRHEPALVACYAGYLAQLGDGVTALRLVEQQFDEQPDDRLVRVVEAIEDVAPEKLLATLEQWLTQARENGVVLRTAGRVALRARLWGKARNFFEGAASRDDPVALTELMRLHEALGNTALARQCLERQMYLHERELPPLPLPKSPSEAE